MREREREREREKAKTKQKTTLQNNPACVPKKHFTIVASVTSGCVQIIRPHIDQRRINCVEISVPFGTEYNSKQYQHKY